MTQKKSSQHVEAEQMFNKMAQLRDSYVGRLKQKWGENWPKKFEELTMKLVELIDEYVPGMTMHETAVFYSQLIGQPAGSMMLNATNEQITKFARENAEYYGHGLFDFIQAARAACLAQKAGSPEAALEEAKKKDEGAPLIKIPKGILQ